MMRWLSCVIAASIIWCFPENSGGSATAQAVYVQTKTMPVITGQIDPPKQIRDFVARNPEFAARAASSRDTTPVTYDETLAATLDKVNQEGNRIKWTPDIATWGVREIWDFPCAIGPDLYDDCDGISIWKMNELMKSGISASSLLLTKGYTETNEGHLVLVVATDKGDFVLDNRFPTVIPAADLIEKGYLFQIRPASGDDLTGPWVVFEYTRMPPIFTPLVIGDEETVAIPLCVPKPLI